VSPSQTVAVRKHHKRFCSYFGDCEQYLITPYAATAFDDICERTYSGQDIECPYAAGAEYAKIFILDRHTSGNQNSEYFRPAWK
jgi:hypothetical protein